MSKILIVDDDVASARTLQLHLKSQGNKVETAYDVDQGLASMESFGPEILILDIRMPGKSGLEGLPEFKALQPEIHIIMITAFHDMESTIEAMQKGAEEYIHKPIDIGELDLAISKIAADNGGDSEIFSVVTDSTGTMSMVGRSRAMKEIFKTIGLVAQSPATVLVTGESGTGKELVAKAIHKAGENPDGPFVVVNCAAVVETLLESDMFGHEKGSFTGASHAQIGKFALANGGAIFLDEVGEMSQIMQAKLLRVLQYKEFTPLGAKKSQKTNARIIAATNVDLADKVASGDFREDLYYRLQVVNIHLPPLRERKEDLVDLVQALLGKINREMRRNVTHISKEVLECFSEYDWPGNIRELENVLMKAVAVCQGDTLNLGHFPEHINTRISCNTDLLDNGSEVSERSSLAEMEHHHVQRVLESVNWHKGKACEILGISRPRLRRMMREYEIHDPSGVVDHE